MHLSTAETETTIRMRQTTATGFQETTWTYYTRLWHN